MGNTVTFPRAKQPRTGSVSQAELELAYRLEEEVWAAFRLSEKRRLELLERIIDGESAESGEYWFDLAAGKVSRRSIDAERRDPIS
jgi:hypothetical protein